MTLLSARTEDQVPFELKGSLFTLTVLHLLQADPEAIDRHLAQKAKQAPGFFANAPVVIDLENLAEQEAPIEFTELFSLLRARGMIPVGVRNGSDAQHAAALLAGLPALPEGRAANNARRPEHRPETPSHYNRLITQPVRSGQQIYAPDGDLIILEAVSPGAEVLADGNIHVYGPLRGRALAGVKSNTQARIFCLSLEAELISIAGRYLVSEQIDSSEQGKTAHIYLSDERLIIKPLSR